jgi:3-polyprenyl-4-hydroxybenzoate decarboxylase
LLIRVTREINKDTELHPLVRWQYRGGIPEKDRKAFLFENVVDSKGKKYDIPVVVGALAATPEIYCLGLGCKPDEIGSVWENALNNQIPSKLVKNAPVQEVVIRGDELDKEGNGTMNWTKKAMGLSAFLCLSPRQALTTPPIQLARIGLQGIPKQVSEMSETTGVK